MSIKHRLALTASLVAMAPFGAAHAQDDGRGAIGALTEEITVTARKREESLDRTPISISAFTGEGLQARGVIRLDSIADFTPNLTLQNNSGFGGASNVAAAYIRGIGQDDFTAVSEPGVGIYIDGVYLGRTVGSLLDIVDLERVEVLRGPQGTLFGRNTIGGAISVTTKKPSTEAFESELSFTYGTDDRIDAQGAVNLPISETLAARITAATFQQDGYIDAPLLGTSLGNRETYTGRIALRWEPTDRLTVDFAFDASTSSDNGVPSVLRTTAQNSNIFNPQGLPLAPPGFPLDADGLPLAPLPPGAPAGPYYATNPPFDAPVDNFGLLNNYLGFFLGGQDCFSGFFTPYDGAGNLNNPACYNNQWVGEGQDVNFSTFPTFSFADIWGGNINVEYDAGFMTVRSITSYRAIESEFSRDQDASPINAAGLDDDFEQDQFSQEFQFLGSLLEDRVNWILGAYYFQEEAFNPNVVDFTPVQVRSGGSVQNESYAAFGQADIGLTDQLTLTAGLRYTKDIRKFIPDQFITIDRTGGAFPPGTRTLPFREFRTSPDDVSPMANLAYQVTPDLLVYATYSQGFKSGGFTQRVFPPLVTEEDLETVSFDPEEVDSYEGGFKYAHPDGLFRVSGAGFYADYTNLQVQVFNGIAPIIQNAAAAEIFGFELEGQYSPGYGIFVEGGVGYTAPSFTEVGANVTDFGPGSEFARISKWNLSAAASWELYTGEFGTFTPRVDWAYRSEYFNNAINSPEIREPGYHNVNANLAWLHPNENVNITFGIINLLDDDYNLVGFHNPNLGEFTVTPNRGRQWWLNITANY